MKILSIHDLATIRKRAEHNLSLREESNEKVTEKCYGLASGAQHLQILICGGTGCKASSSQGITDNLLKAIQKNEITDKVEVITVGCFGFCEKGPIVKIIPDNTPVKDTLHWPIACLTNSRRTLLILSNVRDFADVVVAVSRRD